MPRASGGARPPNPSPTSRKGSRAEDLAARWLAERHGYVVRDRNYRCPEGEIDLVAVDPGGVLCFVEVRSRARATHGGPMSSVTPQKQTRLSRAARRYLAAMDPAVDPPVTRFDVVAVVLEPEVSFTLARGAFEPPWSW